MRSFLVRSLAAATTFASLTVACAAVAQPALYVTAGNALLRNDGGVAISATRLDASGETFSWSKVFEAPPSGNITDVVCDRTTGALCFVGVSVAGGDRRTWTPFSLHGPAQWPAIGALVGAVTDVDNASGTALVIIDQALRSGPTDLAPGVYVSRRESAPNALRLIERLEPGCSRAARFVHSAAASPTILVVQGCGAGGQTGASWKVVSLDGQVISSASPGGIPIALSGDDLVFVGRGVGNAADETLSEIRIPSATTEAWKGRALYNTTQIAGSPVVLASAADPLAPLAIILADGRVLAAANDQPNPSLVSVCRQGHSPGAAQTQLPEAATTEGVSEIQIAGGGHYGIVTIWNTWGLRRQFLISVSGTGSAECAANGIKFVALPDSEAEAAREPAVISEHRTAQSADGDQIPYVLIHQPTHAGPVLIRAYGALGDTNFAMTELPIERKWVEAGGTLVVPTLHGDAKWPAWRVNPIADYKTTAANDLIAVTSALIAAHDASAGDITAIGGSAGAFTVARAVLMRPDLFSAAVLASGPFDLRLLSAGSAHGDAELGPRTGDFSVWFSGSQPSSGRCKAIRFFLYTGQEDNIVDPQNTVSFAGFIKSLGYKGSLESFEHIGHYVLAYPSVAPVILSDLDNWRALRNTCGAA